MRSRTSRLPATFAGLLLLACGSLPATAQNADPKQPAPGAQAPAEPNRDDRRRIDEFAEAARTLDGSAGTAECVWLGRRVVNLLWRDDLDTAFRHLNMYDRFGCPSFHIQVAFRCVVQQGAFDPKAAESLSGRVHACWVNPAMQPPAASVPPSPPNSQATAPGAAKPQ